MDLDQRLLIPPLVGAAVALTLGLSLGGSMQPDLIFGRPGGPQMLSGLSGERAPGPMDMSAGFVSYSGRVPDYVIGTDVIRALEPQPMRSEQVDVVQQDTPAELPRYQAVSAEDHAAPAVETAALATAQDEEPAYPSMAGGRFYGPAPGTPMEAAAVSAGPDAS